LLEGQRSGKKQRSHSGSFDDHGVNVEESPRCTNNEEQKNPYTKSQTMNYRVETNNIGIEICPLGDDELNKRTNRTPMRGLGVP